MTVKFTESFSVDSSKDEYQRFIRGLRDNVMLPDRMSHGLPVLPCQKDKPTEFFDVVLTNGAQSLSLRLRRDNLYLVAIGKGNSGNGRDVQWNAFKDVHPSVPRTHTLGFCSDYGEWTKKAGRREDTQLGKEKLRGAIGPLTKICEQKLNFNAEVAKSLIIIAAMICESMRLKKICGHIVHYYDDENMPRLPLIEQLENSWATLSAALFAHDKDDKTRVPENIRRELEIEDYPGIVEVLGILHQAAPRVEVFDMRILDINGEGEDRGQLYGTVTAVNGLQSVCIYRRDREDHESIEAGQHASLNGPSRAISASDGFTIDFNLMNKGAPSPNDQIARSQIAWNSNDQTNKYDELRTGIINGDYESVALDYVVMSNAAEALVEVVLVNKDGEHPADVYGEIYAQTSAFPDKRIKLFGREGHDHVGVHLHGCVPLLRSALAVPMDASLTIGASLGDHGQTSPDKEIANGTAEFKPEILQSASGLIIGQHGKAEVRVSWT